MYEFLGYFKKGNTNFSDAIIKKLCRLSVEKLNKTPPLINTDRYMFTWRKPYVYRGKKYKVIVYFYDNNKKLRIYLINHHEKKDSYILYYKLI